MQSYDSLTQIHLDALAEKVGGRYRLTRLVSQRMQQINGGHPLLVERRPNEALLAAVCREIEENKVELEMPEAALLAEDEAPLDILGISDEMELD